MIIFYWRFAMEYKRPIARIDYLHTDGSIGESCHFYTESEFLARGM